MIKHKGLGRGLDALLATVDRIDDRLQTLSLDVIRAGKYQPRTRMHEEALNDLADSIRSQGVIQPIVVREVGVGEYELIAGERRLYAARKVGLDKIPAVIKTVPDEAALAIALIENIQRQELDSIEEAQGIQRLIDEFGMSHETAAKTLGRSRSAVTNLLRLLTLPQVIQNLVHAGQLEMGHARALLPLAPALQLKLANDIAKLGLSVREVERRAQKSADPPPSKPATNLVMSQFADRLAQHLNTRVSIRQNNKGSGKVSIEYASLAELERILQQLI